jgi:hypothetical protein
VDNTVRVDALAPIPAPEANAVAVSKQFVAWRAGHALFAAAIGAAAHEVARGDVGHPALDGATLLYDVGERRLVALNLATNQHRTLRRIVRGQLRQPSGLGGRLLYVRATYRRQQLMIGSLARSNARRDRVLYSTVPTGRRDNGHDPGHAHDPGHTPQLWPQAPAGRHDTLWTTALAPGFAYVTRLRQVTGHAVKTVVLRVAR